MSTLGIVLGVLVLLAVLGVLWLIATYNGFVRGRVRVDNGYAQIDVQLKRRYDLIPNLVETVKGYAAHERQTLEAVIKARQQAIDASGVKDQAMAENLLTGALRQIFALSERYPDLKANANFAQLQEELVSTENKISFARQHYNDVVTGYNMLLAVFPSNLVAGMFNFKAREFFETEAPSERQAPKVQF
ncbi:MAG: LemA family protein [Phycisphaeraceae bacterium]|nr:LemA family protein [Phycisphaeraceae bacterium]